jgi:hypothetical protein
VRGAASITVPEAFEHRSLGLVGLHIMHQFM